MHANLSRFGVPYELDMRSESGRFVPDDIAAGKFAKVYRGRRLIDEHPVHRVAIKVLHDRATAQHEYLLGSAEVPLLQQMMREPSERVVTVLDVIELDALCICHCGEVFRPLCRACGATLERRAEDVRGFPALVCARCGDADMISAEDIFLKRPQLFARKPCNGRCGCRDGTVLNFAPRKAIVMELLEHQLERFVAERQRALRELTGVDLGAAARPAPTGLLAFASRAPGLDLIARKVLLLEKVFAMVQIAEAVAWLHGPNQVIHKDLAPDNVMFSLGANAPMEGGGDALRGLARLASAPGFAVKVIDFGLSDRSDKPTLSWYDDDDTQRAVNKLPFLSKEAVLRRHNITDRLQFRPDGRSFVLPPSLMGAVMPLDKIVVSGDVHHQHDLSVERVVDELGARVAVLNGALPADLANARLEHVRTLRQPHDLFAVGAICYHLLARSLADVYERLQPLVLYIEGNQAVPLALGVRYAQHPNPMTLEAEGTYVNARNAMTDPFPEWQNRLLLIILRAMVRGHLHSYAADRVAEQDAGHAARRLLDELWQVRVGLQTEVLSELLAAQRKAG